MRTHKLMEISIDVTTRFQFKFKYALYNIGNLFNTAMVDAEFQKFLVAMNFKSTFA